MTTRTNRLFVAILLAVGLAAGARLQAQTFSSALHNTTLSAAVTAGQTTVTVASCTAITHSSFGNCAVGWFLYVDHEQMRVTAVSGTTLTVTRDPYNPSAHASGAVVLAGPADAASWHVYDPPLTQGAGTDCTTQPIPWVNLTNGNIWVCRYGSAGSWAVTNALPITYNTVSPGLPF